MNDFLSMGGYAAFVWPAYGLSALVMTAIAFTSWRGLKDQEKQLSALQAARQDQAEQSE